MPAVIDATIGAPSANSYETQDEANAYFETRVPIDPVWVTSGQDAVLIMATRTLDALATPYKTFFPGPPPYYRVRPQWTGAPATPTQRLSWPRVGMFDHNGNPLDHAVVSVSAENPAVVETAVPHLLQSGKIFLFGVLGSDPDVNGEQDATIIDSTHFSIPLDVNTAGTGGRVTILPQPLKDAESELAGQLLTQDRTLDNDVNVQGIKSIRAGSVGITFGGDVVTQVIPMAVYDLMPQSWLTDELYIPANLAMFDVVSEV